MRAFVAIELPTELKHRLGAEISALGEHAGGDAVRWSDPATIHLTLRFLGEIDERQLDEVRAGLDQALAEQRAFSLQMDHRLGCFPSWKRPRVFWIGVDGDTEPVLRLNRAIERELRKRGFAAERRGFHPHLTIARVQRGASGGDLSAVAQALQRAELGELGELRVDEISLMQSELHPGGAVHTPIYNVALTGGDR